jgi:toxin ParE1/3/4
VAYTVIWSDYAEDDVQKIAAYISAEDSVPSAVGVITGIITATKRLADFPYSGRIVPRFKNPELREIFIYDYRIVYRIFPEHVEIRLVNHTRQQFPPKRQMSRFK